jgi:hypothetical protein
MVMAKGKPTRKAKGKKEEGKKKKAKDKKEKAKDKKEDLIGRKEDAEEYASGDDADEAFKEPKENMLSPAFDGMEKESWSRLECELLKAGEGTMEKDQEKMLMNHGEGVETADDVWKWMEIVMKKTMHSKKEETMRRRQWEDDEDAAMEWKMMMFIRGNISRWADGRVAPEAMTAAIQPPHRLFQPARQAVSPWSLATQTSQTNRLPAGKDDRSRGPAPMKKQPAAVKKKPAALQKKPAALQMVKVRVEDRVQGRWVLAR